MKLTTYLVDGFGYSADVAEGFAQRWPDGIGLDQLIRDALQYHRTTPAADLLREAAAQLALAGRSEDAVAAYGLAMRCDAGKNLRNKNG